MRWWVSLLVVFWVVSLGCAPGERCGEGDACANGERCEEARCVATSGGDLVITGFVALPSRIGAGGSATLTWTSRRAASCSLSPSFGAVPRSGSVTVRPSETTTWTLSCEGPGGPKTAEAEVTVMGSDAGPIADGGNGDGGDGAADGGAADGGLEDGGDPSGGGLSLAALDGVEHIDPPASVDDVAVGGGAFLFRELEALTLVDTEMFDTHYPGTYGANGVLGDDEPRCQVRPGHRVDSWFLRVSNPSSVELLEGSVTFSREVVAIAWRDGTLRDGDAVFGAVGTTYTDVAGRGVAVGNNDAFSLSDDRRTVSFSVMGTNPDELRVLVAADDGPRPLTQTWTIDIDTVTLLSVGSREDAEHALLLDEGVTTLVEPLPVDGLVPGQYGMGTPPVAGALPAGSTVQSWLVHFDPPVMLPEEPVLVGSLTFDKPVLAVIVYTDSLAASDGVVGRDDVTYALEGPRGTELSSSSDAVWWSSDGKSVRVVLGVTIIEGGVDQLRILTEP